jgi:hypothetical protein
VYSDQAIEPEELISMLRPYAAEVAVEDAKADSYAVSGRRIAFYTAYWSPRLYNAALAPPALGPMRNGPLHHWDLGRGGGAAHSGRRGRPPPW